MSNLNTRKVLFAVFVIVLVSLSCGPPRFTPKGVDIDDEELKDLNNNVAGVYETDYLVDQSDSLGENRLCEPPAYWLSNRTDTLEFKDNKLILSDGKETRTYVYQDFGTQDFCRELDDGKIECISHPEKGEYSITIYESKNNLRSCFFGSQAINRIDQPPIVESQLEDAVDTNVDTNDEDDQTGLFTSDDCSCSGFSVPLNSSSASNNAYKMNIISGVQGDVTGHLTCDWQGDYSSANKTGTIMIYLNVYKFDNAQYAQTLFNKFHNDIASKPPYCAEDDSCTVAIADFGEDRAFYVWNNIYVGGRGELPSDHGANMARLITTSEKYYVFDLLVTHPELELGDTWVSYIAQSVETCVMTIVNSQ